MGVDVTSLSHGGHHGGRLVHLFIWELIELFLGACYIELFSAKNDN